MANGILKWNGSAWQNAPIFKWNGSAWAKADGYKWNGSAWVSITETTYITEFKALTSRSFLGDGSPRGDVATRPWLHLGYYASTTGKESSVIIFDYIAMQKELAGATIDKVELYMKNEHAYYSSGMYLSYQNTAMTSIPASYKPTVAGVYKEFFAKGEGKWITLANFWGTWFASGAATGIYMFNNESAPSSYGYFTAHNTANPPKLRITYKK